MKMKRFNRIMRDVKRNIIDQEQAFEAFDSRFARSAEIVEAEAIAIALSQVIGEAMVGKNG